MIAIVLKVVTNKYFIGASCLFVIFLLGKRLHYQNQEIKRQKGNYEVLIGKSENTLRITKQEFKDYIVSDVQIKRALRDSLKIKAKEVVRLSKTSSDLSIRFKTVLKDSIVWGDSTRYDTVEVYQTFNYRDNWNKVTGVIQDDTISLDIQSRDTLLLITHKYKNGKWFLPKLFSKQRTKTDIVNSNPSASYHIERRIEVD